MADFTLKQQVQEVVDAIRARQDADIAEENSIYSLDTECSNEGTGRGAGNAFNMSLKDIALSLGLEGKNPAKQGQLAVQKALDRFVEHAYSMAFAEVYQRSGGLADEGWAIGTIAYRLGIKDGKTKVELLKGVLYGDEGEKDIFIQTDSGRNHRLIHPQVRKLL